MIVSVLTFGIARDICGAGAINVTLEDGATTEVLTLALVHQYPALKQLSSFMIAVNSEYAGASSIIREGDEVAIIPPVSGG